MHQRNDGISDLESLIKPISSRPNAEIDNFYEEIKEQQQQTALALGISGNKGDFINSYLDPKNTFFSRSINSTTYSRSS
jgi:hypothetical protein